MAFTICLHDKKTDRDYFLEWTNVTNDAECYGMDRITYIDYHRRLYGYDGTDEYTNDKFIESLDNAMKFGTSLRGDKGQKLDELIEYNFSGKNGKTISKEKVIEKYCRESPYYVESKLIYLTKDFTTPFYDYKKGTSFLPHLWAGILGISCRHFKSLLDSEEVLDERFNSYFSHLKIEKE